MMGKAALYERVLRDFHKRFHDEAKAIGALLDSGDYSSAMRRAHSTKGLAGTIGARALQEAALSLELAIRSNAPDLAQPLTHFSGQLQIVIAGIARGFQIDETSPT